MLPSLLKVGVQSQSDERVLAGFRWDEYANLSPLMAEAIEARVLKEVTNTTEASSSKDLQQTVSIEQCQALLQNDQHCRQLFLKCWKEGSFDALRRDARYISLICSRMLNTPISGLSSSRSSVYSDVRSDNYSTNDSVPVSPMAGALGSLYNLTISDGSYTSVQRDYWQINYFNDRHKEIAEWLSLLDYTAIHYEIAKQRERNTGRWFLDSIEFQSWLTIGEGPRILWCPGIPGVGKTVLASLVINHLDTQGPQPERPFLAFIYFDYKLQKQQSMLAVLGSLSRQIYEACIGSSPASILEDLHQSHRTKKVSATLDELSKALKAVVQTRHAFYVVLDALDEFLESYSDHRIRELLLLLLSLGDKVKLLVTSRILGEMEKIFMELGSSRREIHAVDDDIQSYIRGRITAGSFVFLPSSSLTDEIVHVVTEAARGRFLLAKLHMNSVVQYSNAGDVKDALAVLPNGIDETYAEAIERIERQSSHRKELAMKTLMWIAYARRSLWIQELQHALATRHGITRTEDYLTEPSSITAACAGLVVVEDGTDIVRFVHVTVQEYFAQHRHQHFPFAEQKITKICIDYLSLPCFSVQGDFDWGDHPFYDYAALEWGQHAETVEQSSELENYILQFLDRNDPAISLCLEYILYRELVDWYCDDGPGNQGCGVFLAIYHNQNTVLLKMLNSKQHLPLTREGRNPFLFAARLGKLESARLMLSVNTDTINASDVNKRGPLSYASSGGHECLVSLLLSQAEIRVNAADLQGDTPLSDASGRNHESIVKMLLGQPDIDVNTQNAQGSTPLALAARGGHSSVAELLLKHRNIISNLEDSDGRTPLSHAAEQAYEDVVALLLRHGHTNVNAQDKHGRTALSRAADDWASNDHGLIRSTVDGRHKPESRAVTIVKLLLKQVNIDVHLADNQGRTPMQYASRMGYDQVMELLNTRMPVTKI